MIEKLPHPNLASDRAVCIKINEIIDAINPTYEISEEVLAGWIEEYMQGGVLGTYSDKDLARFLKKKGV